MNVSSRRVVLINDPDYEPTGGPHVQFRLTYSGLLFSTGNDSRINGDKRADHKHNVRAEFHPQLKRLWEITPFLKRGSRSGPSEILLEQGPDPIDYRPYVLAKEHAQYGKYRFVPLVTKELNLICGIEILFLRPQKPGNLLGSGDLDGRIKTLLDSLSIPDSQQGYERREAGKEKSPMYTLLEDDSLVTKLSVETDQLLEVGNERVDPNEVKLVITVTLCPYDMRTDNMQFG